MEKPQGTEKYFCPLRCFFAIGVSPFSAQHNIPCPILCPFVPGSDSRFMRHRIVPCLFKGQVIRRSKQELLYIVVLLAYQRTNHTEK